MPRLSLLRKLLSRKDAAAVRHGATLLSTRHDPLVKAIRKGQRGRWREIDEFDRRVKALRRLARADRGVIDRALQDLTQRTHEPITAHMAWDLLVALRAVEKEYSET